MINKTIFIALTLILISLINCTDYQVKSLILNQVYNEKTIGDTMNIYNLNLNSNLSVNKDLVVDAKLINNIGIFDAPLVFISTTPLPNPTNKEEQWVCGQLGMENCFVPSKYLNNLKKLYIGVICNSCHYSLKLSIVEEEALVEGQTNLFHLKKGDTKVFNFKPRNLNFENLQITAFNLKKSNYDMKAEIVDSTKVGKTLEAPITQSWIGEKQLVIKSTDAKYVSPNITYRVIITALEAGVFNLEALSSDTVLTLKDKDLKFQNLSKGQKICYKYNISPLSSNEDVIVDIKAIKGSLNVYLSPNELPTDKKFTNEFEVTKDHKFDLSKALRDQHAAASGTWFLCAHTTEAFSFYAIQVYLASNAMEVLDYKRLLLNLVKSKGIYDIDNLILNSKYNTQKTLVESDALVKKAIGANAQRKLADVVAPTSNTSADPTVRRILVNGHGVGGIAVGILFFFIALCGLSAIMALFVNTKLLTNPLLLGKVEY